MLARLQKHPHVAPLILWTIIWFAFFSTILLGVEYLAQSDLLTQFHAFGRFQAQEMLAGRLPLWSPGSYGGFPFAADTQAAVFYLPRWLTVLLSAPFSFSYHALTIEAVLHVWLLGCFTYLLAFDITNNRWAGLLAAVAFSLSGYITSYPILQLAILETITWLPLVLLMLRRAVGGKRPLPWTIAAGLVLGLAFLAGHPQTFLHSAYLAAAYYLFLTIRAKWAWRWILGLGLLLVVTTIGITAVLWLPALQYLQVTTRSEVTYEFVATGFDFLDYLQLIVPQSITAWAPMYIGFPALLLVILAWFLRRKEMDAKLNSEILFWTFVAIITLLISLGDKGILFEAIYRVPGFSLFRQQERIASLFTLSLSLLTALGFTLWQNSEDADRRFAVKRLAWVAIGALILAGFVLLATKKEDWLFAWAQLWLVTALFLLLLWRQSYLNWRAMGMVLLLSLNLFLLSREQLNYQAGSPAIYWPQPAWLTALQNDNPGRIDTLGFFPVNTGELHNVQDIRGISPLKPAALSRFDELPFTTRWQLLNVTHVVAQEAFEDALAPMASMMVSLFPGQTFTGNLYRYEDVLPRAWLVYDPIVVADDEAAWQHLVDPEFDPANQVVLTNPSGDFTAVSAPTNAPTVKIEQTTSTTYNIQVTTETPAILVLSEWKSPNWQGRLNGQSELIETANYAFQAIVLPAGAHEVQFLYVPKDVYGGVFFALLTLVFALFLAWKWRPQIETHTKKINWENYQFHLHVSPVGPQIMGKQFNKLLLLTVLFIGFALRVALLGNQELRGDEAFSYLFAQQPFGEIIPALISEGDPHSPFHYLLLHGWMGLGGDSEFALRYISLLPSLLLVPLLYQLGRLLHSRKLGIFAAFWLAISASQIWLAQDVRNQYMLTLLWGLWATFILVGPLQRPNFSRRRRLLCWIAYIILAALTVYSHYFGLFILLAHGGFLFWPKNGRWQRIGAWVVAGFAALLLFLPWIVAILPTLLAAGQLSDPSQPELARYLVEVGIELTMGSDVIGWWPRWLFAGALLMVGLGSVYLFKERPNWGILLTSWLVGATFLIYLIRFSRATFNNFYIAVAAPAWWLLFAVGFFMLWRQPWRGWRAIASLLVLLILLANGAGLTNYYFDPAYGRSNGYRELANRIDENWQDGDLFVPQFPDPVWGYYLRNVAIPNQMQPATPNQTTERSEAELQTVTETYDRIWFVPYRSGWDSENVVGRWLDYHLLHEAESTHQKLTLWTYRPLRTADEVTTSIESVLNEEILLNSAYLTLNGQPVDLQDAITVSATDQLKVSLIWSAQDSIDSDYTVFVHLLAEDGLLLAQHDGVPLLGTRPTSSWQVEEQLLDRHELQIGETGFQGNGRLIVGMYRADTLERLPFANGETALELAPVVIEP